MPASPSIHVFIGSDEALVKESALRLVEKLAPKDNEFGLEIIAGRADNADQVNQIVGQTLQAIQTLPFFGGGKLVWLQDANFFDDSKAAKAELSVSAIESLVGTLERALPPDVIFVMTAGGLDQRKSVNKRLGKIANVTTHDRLDTTKAGWERDVKAHVLKRATILGIRFRPHALESFVQRVGSDTRSIDAELEKLAVYAGGEEVSEGIVSTLVAQSHAGFIFDIGKAILKRQLPRVLELIDFQINRGESAITLLLAAIVPQVRNLLYAKELIDVHHISSGRNYNTFQRQIDSLPAEATMHLPKKKDGTISAYPLFLASEEASKFTLPELRAAFEACLEVNLRLVTSSLDTKVLLHQLATRILLNGVH